jgi:hypothetical protein
MVMRRLGPVGLGLLAARILTACSADTDFKRPDAATFQLGRRTEKEIRERFGEPRSQATIQANDRTIKVLRYVYAEAAPYVEKVPARAMVYSFHEGTLVGFDYSSSFSSDKTAYYYSYSRTDKPPLGGALKTVVKELAIIFDSRGIVTDTKLAISGNK